MRKILTEDMIERACIERLCPERYDFINAFISPNKVLPKNNILETEDDNTGREDIKEVVLPEILVQR